MLRNAFALMAVGILGVCILLDAQASPKQPAKKEHSASAPRDGEQRFRTNCGRCHNPPESIRPSEARAVVRHMRIRAMLGKEDEKLILEFLAP
jgi:mono/diheme cytochrome c family protein